MILLITSNTDTCIDNFEDKHLFCLVESFDRVLAVLISRNDLKFYATLLCELECIREKVLENLLEALAVREQRPWRVGLNLYFECQIHLFGDGSAEDFGEGRSAAVVVEHDWGGDESAGAGIRSARGRWRREGDYADRG